MEKTDQRTCDRDSEPQCGDNRTRRLWRTWWLRCRTTASRGRTPGRRRGRAFVGWSRRRGPQPWGWGYGPVPVRCGVSWKGREFRPRRRGRLGRTLCGAERECAEVWKRAGWITWWSQNGFVWVVASFLSLFYIFILFFRLFLKYTETLKVHTLCTSQMRLFSLN